MPARRMSPLRFSSRWTSPVLRISSWATAAASTSGEQVADVGEVGAVGARGGRERAGRETGRGRDLERIRQRGEEHVVHAVEVALELDDVVAPGECAGLAHAQRGRLRAGQGEAYAL